MSIYMSHEKNKDETEEFNRCLIEFKIQIKTNILISVYLQINIIVRYYSFIWNTTIVSVIFEDIILKLKDTQN